MDTEGKAANKIFEGIRSSIVKKQITPELINALLVSVMELVEFLKPEDGKKLSGPAKKSIVLQVIEKIVEELAPENVKDNLRFVVKHILPGFVDTIVSATKKQIDINVKKIKEGKCC